jgi:hypothetical protein
MPSASYTEEEIMRYMRRSRPCIGLASLLLAWIASGSASFGQVAPTVTTGLRVNGVAAACGVTVASGNQVTLLLSSNQNGNARVTIRKGTGAAAFLAQGAVTAGLTYRVNVTAGTADDLLRTFTVTVTNSTGQVGSQTCGYIVAGQGGQTLPVVTTDLLVNGGASACGATVASGARVRLLLSSNQNGTARVTIRKGTGADTFLAQGAVTAGAIHWVDVTAGAADGLTRVFTVTVTNNVGGTASQTCSYTVGGQGGQTIPVITTSLVVNGVAAACGATALSGQTVGLRLSSNQDGFAVVTARVGNGPEIPQASGRVTAGLTYRVNVTAGAANGQLRTFTVTVTNNTNQTGTATCSFAVQ